MLARGSDGLSCSSSSDCQYDGCCYKSGDVFCRTDSSEASRSASANKDGYGYCSSAAGNICCHGNGDSCSSGSCSDIGPSQPSPSPPSYTSICSQSGSTLTAPSGVISDGSGDYSSNANCYVILSSPGKTITLTFTSFSTEPCCDKVGVYSCSSSACTTTTELPRSPYSGSTVPGPVHGHS
jgi:hypothetical protein